MQISIPSHLTDGELLAAVKRFALSEREATVSLVAHLAELDARRLYLGLGFASLFTYCREALALSEHEAYLRIEAARTARRFPVVLGLLAEGAANLTTVRLLAPFLTAENHAELLAAASRRSKRQVEELVARRFPRPDVPSSVRKLPAPTPRTLESAAPAAATGSSTTAIGPPALAADPGADPVLTCPERQNPEPSVLALMLPAAIVASAARRRQGVTPLSAERYEIRFTATADTLDKLRLAQDLLRHAVPDGDTAEIVDRALTALLEDLARKKFAATDRPRKGSQTAPGSRHVPAAVKRAVWLRDCGRCAFVAQAGRRCQERGFLEFHHVKPYGAGGEATVENLELRCRGHNAHEAELFYGRRERGSGEGFVKEWAVAYESAAVVATRSRPSSARLLDAAAHPEQSKSVVVLRARPSAVASFLLSADD